MATTERPAFQLTLGEMQLSAPETPQYLEVALRLLQARLRELQGAAPSPFDAAQGERAQDPPAAAPPPAPPSLDITVQAPPTSETSLAETLGRPDAQQAQGGSFDSAQDKPLGGVAIHESPLQGRRRWFRDQLPRITWADGIQVTPQSLEELKALLRGKGLAPHPRGDASMLLWQVRNRLLGFVEAVGVGGQL
jgi:hypothetical protein